MFFGNEKACHKPWQAERADSDQGPAVNVEILTVHKGGLAAKAGAGAGDDNDLVLKTHVETFSVLMRGMEILYSRGKRNTMGKKSRSRLATLSIARIWAIAKS